MIQSFDKTQNTADLVGREDDWQFEFWIGTGKFKLGWPSASQGFFPEHFDRTKGLGAGLASDLFVLFEINEVLAKLFGRELVRRTVVILTDLADTGVVGLLGSPTDGQELQVVGEGFQDGMGGTFFICIGLLLLVDRSASPFAGLRSASILK